MMAETTIERVGCGVCGAEIREGSLFCYNCGSAVTKDLPSVEPSSNNLPTTVEEPTPTRPPLRSAASLRKRSQSLRRQPIEVSWEPAGESPRVFFVATILLASVALVLFLIAMYLR